MLGPGPWQQGKHGCDGVAALAAKWGFSLLHPSGMPVTECCAGGDLVLGQANAC